MKPLFDKNNVEIPLYDKNGREIKEFAVIKVFHFIGHHRKRHYMYKWVRLIEDQGKKYWYAQHLSDDSAFFEKSVTSKWTGYTMRVSANDQRILLDTEIVQQYDDHEKRPMVLVGS